MKESISQILSECVSAFAGQYKIVPGEGDPNARLMLVGEAPGRQEEEQGRPFVGQAGKNLSEFLALVHMQREALYITNSVKFRPTREGASGRLSNRTPVKDEIARFNPYLAREIAAVRPLVVATLGNTALHAVLAACGLEGEYARTVIGDVHGKPIKLGETLPWLFPLYHPASIIYRRNLKPVYEEDVRALAAFMESTQT